LFVPFLPHLLISCLYDDVIIVRGKKGKEADKMQGHINNLYNTTFWALIQMGGLDAKSAEKELMVSYSLKKKDEGFGCEGGSTLTRIGLSGSGQE